jgi:hypothetical protein
VVLTGEEADGSAVRDSGWGVEESCYCAEKGRKPRPGHERFLRLKDDDYIRSYQRLRWIRYGSGRDEFTAIYGPWRS